MRRWGLAVLCGAMLCTQAARAAEPVRRIEIFVEPYYVAARSPDAQPRVAVGKSYDALLASNRKEDIVAVMQKVEAEPRLVTPMTMMVLAIRLYDMGLRDDAVFWFYAAKARFTTLDDVIDLKASGLAGVAEAVKNFAVLAGPIINGYAFCERPKQYAANVKAIAWAESNPYGALVMQQLKAKPGERDVLLKRSIADQKAFAGKENASFADPKFAEAYALSRRRNEADQKFCWK